MFFRTAIKDLENWRVKSHRKPLVLRGARQVGKTTLVDEFGKQFPNYIKLNLERHNQAELFNLDIPMKQLVSTLFAVVGKKRNPGDTLLFIDEIQNSPQAMAKLRYFYEDAPELHVIAAGSLLENIVDVKSSFPVGRVEFMALRPCSFIEFLGAIGEETLVDLLSLPDVATTMHDRLMSLVNTYAIVGGMPEAVQRYSETLDLLAVDEVFESLLQGYRDDVEKYTLTNKLTDVVRYILTHGWCFSAERIKLNKFAESDYNSKVVGEAFSLLHKAMLAELAYPSTSLGFPALPNLSRSPKLLWLDTGIVNYKSSVRRDILGSKDITDIWRGRIGEQLVAQEILTLDKSIGAERMFWIREKHQSSAEIDFLYTYNNTVIPIEVKTGNNAHLNSLHAYVDDTKCKLAIRVWGQPYSKNQLVSKQNKNPFTLINLPYYMLNQLRQIIEEHV